MLLVKLIKAILIIFVFLATFLPVHINIPAFATEIQDSLDELRFMSLQIEAVATDMHMYLGWFFDDKEVVKDGSSANIKELNNIKDYLTSLKVPYELVKIKELELQMADKLIELYDGVEVKDLEKIKPEFEKIQEYNSNISEELEKTWMKHRRNWKDLPEDYAPISKDIELAKSKADKDIYFKAVQLIEKKDRQLAYENLDMLRERYRGTVLEDYIMLKISDCLLMANSNLHEVLETEPLDTKEDGLEILSEIVERNMYSPVLYEAFYKWRTMQQYCYYGSSNMSPIPNKMYNEKRWAIVQTIKEYLKDSPDDSWAKLQIDLLLDLEIITRGGYFGNNNIMHWGYLYTDIGSGKELNEEKRETNVEVERIKKALEAAETTDASRSLLNE